MGIYIEMNIFFDNNFDVYKIERILNIKPSDCKRKNETRMSPFNKNEHLEGYWSLVTDTFEELDIKPVIDDLLRKLEGKLEIFLPTFLINHQLLVLYLIPQMCL